MNAFESLGYMTLERDILYIRNTGKDTKCTLTKSDFYRPISDCGYIKPIGLNLTNEQVISQEWELGWRCELCTGGEIEVSHPDPQDDYTLTCHDCDAGIRWEKEY